MNRRGAADGLQVVPISAVDPVELGTFLAAASADEALCDATYLPPAMGHHDALAWAHQRLTRAWALRFEGRLVGWFEIGAVHCDCGFDLPEGTFEREVWLLAEARGRRLIRSATTELRGELLAAGATHLVGVTWESNAPAVQGMANAGFTRLGLGWWEYGEETPGWCEVWLLDLRE